MLWDPFLYCINDSIQGNSETGNKVFVLPSKVAINNEGIDREWEWVSLQELPIPAFLFSYR